LGPVKRECARGHESSKPRNRIEQATADEMAPLARPRAHPSPTSPG
jgi:hypothetical protein